MGKTPVIVGHDPATCSLYSGVGPSPGDPLDRAAVLRQPTGLSHGTGFDNLVTGAHVEGQSNDSFRGNRREFLDVGFGSGACVRWPEQQTLDRAGDTALARPARRSEVLVEPVIDIGAA